VGGGAVEGMICENGKRVQINKTNMELVDKIFENRHNHILLNFLKISKEKANYYKIGEEAGSPFDEGSMIFFFKYGKNLPDSTKVTISIWNFLVNPDNGLIFGFQWGRFTFVIRCDFPKLGISNTNLCRVGNTLDSFVDFTALGENWCIMDISFEGEEETHLKFSYELSKNYS